MCIIVEAIPHSMTSICSWPPGNLQETMMTQWFIYGCPTPPSTPPNKWMNPPGQNGGSRERSSYLCQRAAISQSQKLWVLSILMQTFCPSHDLSYSTGFFSIFYKYVICHHPQVTVSTDVNNYFANKGLSSQSYGFSSSHVWMWELGRKLDVRVGKKAECRKTDAFELWCWRRFLRVFWTARRSNQSILKDWLSIHWKDWC